MKKILVIRHSIVTALLVGVLIVGTSVQGDTSQISALEVVKDAGGTASYVISKTGAVEVQEFMMDDPPRLVVDFIGATHQMTDMSFEGDETVVDRVRSSQFSEEPNLVVRVVFDLKYKAEYTLTEDENAVRVSFVAKNKPSTEPSMKPVERAAVPAVEPIDMAAVSAVEPAKRPAERKVMQSAMDPMAGTTVPAEKEAEKEPVKAETVNPLFQSSKPAQAPKKPEPAKAVPMNATDNVTTRGWDKPAGESVSAVSPLPAYAASAGMVKNKSITIDVQDADIQTVLHSLSEFSETNIIAGPEVEGEVTAHLKDVPWRQAMDIILKAHGFGYREEYGMIRVSTIDKLTKEELEIQAAERQKDELLPLETRIIEVSFANATEMRDALKEILTQRGSMEVESGANALIVTDIAKNIEKISAMVAELDKKIKQVEIVAKLVDVDFEATREIGVQWNMLNLSNANVNGVGDLRISAPAASPTGQLRVGTIQSWGEVQAIIDMMEKENKANIISNPRIVTADNREASILVGKEIPLIVSDEAGNPITELTKIGIILRVTPHVNSDNTITLDLHPEVSDLSSQATVQGGVVIVLSEADTRVVVGDGDTAVIGGLISEVESSFENGVPVLKDIPLLGGLFRLSNDTKKKRELVIFVTPKIVEG
jgi:type IV pilus assembly protein PilQ